jgi:hypothetical protein
LSPRRGPFGRGELSSDEKAEAGFSGGDWTDGEDGASDDVASTDTDASDSVVASDEMVELEDSSSECATVYFTVVISSSRGVRKETLFSAGNSGLDEVIFRGASERARLLERIEVKLWGCLYGITMVAESVEADVSPDERVEAELGVEALEVSQLLSMQRRGLDGRAAGVLGAGGS